MIFRRASSQPATPADSANIPSGWYTDVASLGSGPDPIWSCVGQREHAGLFWQWQLPIKATGEDGADGNDGQTGQWPYSYN